ncbi:MAG: hypothetical protein E3J66_07755 [Dehalococcoidia bacterium]|nr:MAG: hypothetical protein E3J66_07755 [Dehalococcoidia bacterium]
MRVQKRLNNDVRAITVGDYCHSSKNRSSGNAVMRKEWGKSKKMAQIITRQRTRSGNEIIQTDTGRLQRI